MHNLQRILEETKQQRLAAETKVLDLQAKVVQVQAELLQKESECQRQVHAEETLKYGLNAANSEVGRLEKEVIEGRERLAKLEEEAKEARLS